jgi:hypothetical protein
MIAGQYLAYLQRRIVGPDETDPVFRIGTPDKAGAAGQELPVFRARPPEQVVASRGAAVFSIIPEYPEPLCQLAERDIGQEPDFRHDLSSFDTVVRMKRTPVYRHAA